MYGFLAEGPKEVPTERTGIDKFFAFARERHNIALRRARGEPPPWTKDPILQHHRFTNVFRELDKTTVWFKEFVREPMRSKPEVLLATVLFRWFNRITTGEAIFCTPDLWGKTPFDWFLNLRSIPRLRTAIVDYCGEGPYVTGAFIVNTPTGMSKLDGVLWAFGEFAKGPWHHVAEELLCQCDGGAPYKLEGAPVVDQWGLEYTWQWLRSFPRIGDFQAYEFVTDLRHTDLLGDAHDINTWANPGPGAKRGLQYIYGGDRRTVPDCVRSRSQQVALIHELLDRSMERRWGGLDPDYPVWEMREVEHTLCEYAKYEMVKRGEGKTKGVYSA